MIDIIEKCQRHRWINLKLLKFKKKSKKSFNLNQSFHSQRKNAWYS